MAVIQRLKCLGVYLSALTMSPVASIQKVSQLFIFSAPFTAVIVLGFHCLHLIMSLTPRSLPLRSLHSASPSRVSTIANSTRCFATSQVLTYPRSKTPRNNKRRGMSAIRGTGIPGWINLSVSAADLKTPRKVTPAYETDEDHGLWGFFNQSRTILTPPDKMHEHGMLGICNCMI
jgi:hypothetical protein